MSPASGTSGRPPAADADTIRSTNTFIVFDYIWSHRATDRAEISRETGLSPTTVSAITGQLLDAGVIRESGSGKSRGGRKPIVLEVVPSSRLVVGVEVGASHITAVVLDLFGTVVAEASESILTSDAGEESVVVIRKMINSVLESVGTDGPVAGIGIGLQSLIARPDWRDIDLRHEITGTFDVPLWIDNDANLGALAEAWWGKGQDVADFTYVKLGGGVGAGHIVGGQIYHGHTGAAGEIGHTPSDPGKRDCRCGRSGCLEAFISSRTLVEQFEAASEGQEFSGVHTIDRMRLIDAANGGDEVAIRILTEAGERLGITLSTVIGLLSPAMIVLAGPITSADAFMAAVREQIDRYAFIESVESLQLVISELDQNAGAIGAATLVMSELFRVGVTTTAISRQVTGYSADAEKRTIPYGV